MLLVTIVGATQLTVAEAAGTGRNLLIPKKQPDSERGYH
jgi:hypothetical protein